MELPKALLTFKLDILSSSELHLTRELLAPVPACLAAQVHCSK